MLTFNYRSRGTANEDWHEATIEAADVKDAKQKLDQIFGIERDEMGNQLNPEAVTVELVKE